MITPEVAKLLELPAEELAELAAALWDSLEQEPPPLIAEERAIFDERLAKAEANPNAGIPWEQVKAAHWPDE